MISSWPPRWCGIAIYAENLVEALRAAGADVHIVCHTDGGRKGERQVYPVIDQGNPGWYWPVLEAVREIRPDVIHIQHEFGLFTYFRKPGVYDFEPQNAFELSVPLFRWRVERIPAVVTYHSVFSHLTFEEASYYDHMFALAAANIVHEPFQKAYLPMNIGRVPDNVFVCPHGAGRNAASPAVKAKAKERLGIDRLRPVAGVMGWWEPNKGFERMIRIWPKVVECVPDAILLFAGGVRPGSPAGAKTRGVYLDLIAESPARSAIRVVEGAFPREEYLSIMAAFDVAVLPYLHASQSGNLAHAYEVGVPVVASSIEGLKSSLEASGAGLLIPGRDDAEANEALLEAVVRLLTQPHLRRQMALKSRRYVRDVISWERVARRHLEIYKAAHKRVRDPACYANYLDHRVHV